MSATKVLVVDDEPTVREVVAGYLRRDGHEVFEAADGTTALELLETEPARSHRARHDAPRGERSRRAPPGPDHE